MEAIAIETRGRPGVPTRPHLWVAVVLSLFLHAVGGVTASHLGVGSDSSAANRKLAWSPRTPQTTTPPLLLDWDTPPPPPPPEPEAPKAVEPPPTPPQLPPGPERLRLGIEDSNQRTDNVMGFNDPTEHVARESEVDQPALDPMPGGPLTPPPSPASEPTPQSSPAEPTPPQPPAASPAAAPEPVPPPAEELPPGETVSMGPPEPSEIERLAAPKGEGDVKREASPEIPAGEPTPHHPGEGPPAGERVPKPAMEALIPGKQLELPDVGDEDRTTEAREEKPAPAAPLPMDPLFAHPAPAAAENAPSPPASPPILASDPGPAGEKSEKEADAASRAKPIEVILGRPAAGEGLEIITKRPRRNPFSLVTRVISLPSNPIIEVNFDRDGRVTTARIIRSSGVADVDGPVLAAVYAWTAKGKRLAELPVADPKAGIRVTVTILLR